MRRSLLVLFVTIGALAAMTTSADAAAPDRTTIDVDDTFIDPGASAMCGVPIEISVLGTVDNTVFFDNDGNLVRVLQRINVSESFTNLDSGAMIFAPNVGSTIHITIGGAPDGRNLVRFTGLEGQIIIPGTGSVIQDAGQTLLAGLPGTIPEILAQHGHFEGMGGPFPGACQYLT